MISGTSVPAPARALAGAISGAEKFRRDAGFAHREVEDVANFAKRNTNKDI